jgi:peptide/nickel transport system substrate-binding protein
MSDPLSEQLNAYVDGRQPAATLPPELAQIVDSLWQATGEITPRPEFVDSLSQRLQNQPRPKRPFVFWRLISGYGSRLAWTAVAILFILLVFNLFAPGTTLVNEETPTLAATLAPTAQPSAATLTATVPVAPTSTASPTLLPAVTATAQPQTLTICLGGEPDSLYIYKTTAYTANIIREAIYDGPIDIVDYGYQPVILEKLPSLADGDARIEAVAVQPGDWLVDSSGAIVPLAAGVRLRPSGCHQDDCAIIYQGGPLSMDQQTATFTLRPDVKWSDGTAVTAADSVFSYETGRATTSAFDPDRITAAAGLPTRPNDPVLYTAGYTAVTEYSVRWTGLPGFIDPYYQVNFFTPLPRQQLARFTAAELLDAQESTRLPMGWGPFVLRQWLPGDRIVAERNPHYFRAAEGLPYFDRLVFRFLAGTPVTRIAALQDGRCDLLTLDGIGLAPDDPLLAELVALDAAGQISLHPITTSTWEHLTFNLAAGADERPSFFADKRTRQAVAHCVNRQALAEQATLGYSPAPDTYLPPGHPLLRGLELPTYAYDPEAGKLLLAAAGWQEAANGGVRQAQGVAGVTDGTALAIELLTTAANPLRASINEAIAADLAACGIAVTLTYQPASLLFAEEGQGPLSSRRFDLAQFAWISSSSQCRTTFSTAAIPTAENGWHGFNFGGFSHPDFDAACQAGETALWATAAYTANHRAGLRLFAAELPALPLFLRVAFAASRPDLLGLHTEPAQPLETQAIESFRLTPVPTDH